MTACKAHRRYKAIRKPSVNCRECWKQYRSRQKKEGTA